jgi:hypothetical protein
MGRVAMESLSLHNIISIHLSLRSTGDWLEQATLGRVPLRRNELGFHESASSGDTPHELSMPCMPPSAINDPVTLSLVSPHNF